MGRRDRSASPGLLCAGRVERAKRVARKWTQEEQDALLQALSHVSEQGADQINWADVSKLVPGRSGKQCREKYKNDLRPDICKGAWLSSEEYVLSRVHSRCGNQWAVIAQFLPGRSENAIKNHWNATLRSKQEVRTRTFLGVYCRTMLEHGGLPSAQVFDMTLTAYSESRPLEALDTFAVPEHYFANVEMLMISKPATTKLRAPMLPGTKPRRRRKQDEWMTDDEDLDEDDTSATSDNDGSTPPPRPARARSIKQKLSEPVTLPSPIKVPTSQQPVCAPSRHTAPTSTSIARPSDIWTDLSVVPMSAPMRYDPVPIPSGLRAHAAAGGALPAPYWPNLRLEPMHELAALPPPPHPPPSNIPTSTSMPPPATRLPMLNLGTVPTTPSAKYYATLASQSAVPDFAVPFIRAVQPSHGTMPSNFMPGADAAVTITLAPMSQTPFKLHQEWSTEEQSPLHTLLALTPFGSGGTPASMWGAAMKNESAGIGGCKTLVDQSPMLDLLGLLQDIHEDTLSDFAHVDIKQVDGGYPMYVL